MYRGSTVNAELNMGRIILQCSSLCCLQAMSTCREAKAPCIEDPLMKCHRIQILDECGGSSI